MLTLRYLCQFRFCICEPWLALWRKIIWRCTEVLPGASVSDDIDATAWKACSEATHMNDGKAIVIPDFMPDYDHEETVEALRVAAMSRDLVPLTRL